MNNEAFKKKCLLPSHLLRQLIRLANYIDVLQAWGLELWKTVVSLGDFCLTGTEWNAWQSLLLLVVEVYGDCPAALEVFLAWFVDLPAEHKQAQQDEEASHCKMLADLFTI